jgi:hypothetical protein
MVKWLKICAENINGLCPETSEGDEKTEWIEKKTTKAMHG